MGEVGGLPPEGFDFGNSPTRILEHDLTGMTLIQRTGAGTQGAVRMRQCGGDAGDEFCRRTGNDGLCRRLKPDEINFVITGGMGNDEDVACADFWRSSSQVRKSRRRISSNGYMRHAMHWNTWIIHNFQNPIWIIARASTPSILPCRSDVRTGTSSCARRGGNHVV
jgi:hypothetical protein